MPKYMKELATGSRCLHLPLLYTCDNRYFFSCCQQWACTRAGVEHHWLFLIFVKSARWLKGRRWPFDKENLAIEQQPTKYFKTIFRKQTKLSLLTNKWHTQMGCCDIRICFQQNGPVPSGKCRPTSIVATTPNNSINSKLHCLEFNANFYNRRFRKLFTTELGKRQSILTFQQFEVVNCKIFLT